MKRQVTMQEMLSPILSSCRLPFCRDNDTWRFTSRKGWRKKLSKTRVETSLYLSLICRNIESNWREGKPHGDLDEQFDISRDKPQRSATTDAVGGAQSWPDFRVEGRTPA